MGYISWACSFYSLSSCDLEIDRFSSKQGGVRIAVTSSVAPCHVVTSTAPSEVKEELLFCRLLCAACLTQFPF